MPEYLTPGVYVEEFEIGAKPIEGVSTSTAGFLGETERGPTRPRLVTSWLDYQRKYGGMFDDAKYLPISVYGFFLNGGKRCYIARITDQEGAGPALLEIGPIRIRAVGPGTWGNRIAVVIRQGQIEGFRLQVAYWKKPPETLFDPFIPGNALETPQPTSTEDFDDLVLDENSPNNVEKRINNGLSNFIEVERIEGAGTEIPPPQDIQLLGGGADGAPVLLGDYEGEHQDVDKRTGLAAFRQPEYRDIAIVYAPNANDIGNLPGRIMTHCELDKYRFAIIDAPRGQRVISQIDPRSNRSSKYAAFYYPWIWIVDSESGKRKLVPPGGYVAGIYARNDTERGVFKAPANEVIRGAVEMEFQIEDGEQGILNPKGVNCLRKFPGRGNRVWGARTLAADPLWKYVNVRRLFIFIENSIYQGTQWVVFEPNNERLWARVKQTIEQFLRTQWRAGALMGLKEEEAFFVKADRTTMTQDDLDNGRLIVMIGIAPVKPAEFVIFRIAQFTAGAEV